MTIKVWLPLIELGSNNWLNIYASMKNDCRLEEEQQHFDSKEGGTQLGGEMCAFR